MWCHDATLRSAGHPDNSPDAATMARDACIMTSSVLPPTNACALTCVELTGSKSSVQPLDVASASRLLLARILWAAPSFVIPQTHLHVDGLVVGGHGSFLDGFAEGGVAMGGPGNVFSGRAILHGKHALWDELAGIGAHDVGTQDLVGGGICHKLDHAVGVIHSLGSAVGQEGELAALQGTHRRLKDL